MEPGTRKEGTQRKLVAHVLVPYIRHTETFIYDRISHARTYSPAVLSDEPSVNLDLFPFKPIYTLADRTTIVRKANHMLGRVLDYLPYYNEMVRRLNPAVLHAHYGPVGAALVGLRRKTGVPLITSFYGIDASALLKNEYYKKVYSRLWQDGDMISVLSQNMKEALAAAGCPEAKIRIHHLAVDTDALAPLPSARPIAGPIRISCVCRLVEKKGVDTLIRAVAAAGKHVEIKLDIAGAGPLEPELRALCDELGAGKIVHFQGRLHRPQALLLMARSHVFALLSRTAADGDMEGTPTALIEAGALGLPSVSTLHAGIPEIISHKNSGILVPENDPAAAAEAIALLASDPDMRHRLGVNARAKICSDFSIHKVIRRIEADYDSLQS